MVDRFICAKTDKIIFLEKHLGQGGEGTVWTTNRPGCCAKVYKPECVTPEQHNKLKLMLRHKPHLETSHSNNPPLAWVQDILLDNNRQFAGFIMPTVNAIGPLDLIYHPEERRQEAPTFSWYDLHIVARNIASVIAALHEQGYVIGDIKDDNILVSKDRAVSFIDTDSLQIRDPATRILYLGRTGTSGYVPQELLGKSFTTIERTRTHDAFGLGILIHQLLFSTSPFTAVFWKGKGPQPTPDEYVARGLWAHTPSTLVKPSPFTAPLNIVHPQIQAYFHQCFTAGHKDPQQRPTAKQWKAALTDALDKLKPCKKKPLHYYHHDESYTQSTNTCYWCQAANNLGVDIFGKEPYQKPAVKPPPQPTPRQPIVTPTPPRPYNPPVQQKPTAYQANPSFDRSKVKLVLSGLAGGIFILSCLVWAAKHFEHQKRRQKLWQHLYATKSCINCNLRNEIFPNLKLVSIDLRGADLSGSTFQNTSLVGANFSGAILTNTTFKDSRLTGAHFRGATLDNSSFKGNNNTIVPLRKTDFSQASLVGASFGHNIDLAEANFNAADLTEVHFKKSRFGFDGVNLYRSSFIEAHLESATLNAANLTNANLTGAILTGADLTNADFHQAILDHASLQNTSLGNTQFDFASLIGTDLRGATFNSTNCRHANLEQAVFSQESWWYTLSLSCQP